MINNIILDIDDINGDGKYNVNDLLEMSNEDILKQNGSKKFDIILANPPWGQNIHYEFTQKFLDLADQVISIMPNSIVKRDSKHFKKFKDAYNDKLYDVEEVDSKLFKGTNMQNCCIFCFKDHIDGLHIKYLDGKEENLKCINEKDYSGFTPYEKEIVKYLYNEKPNVINGASGGSLPPKKFLDKYIQQILNKLPDNNVYMTCLCNYSAGKAIYFTSQLGQIFKNKNELKEWLYQRGGKVCHYMYFDNEQCAENCKIAMSNPVIRFTLLKTQYDQNIRGNQYKYIPNIKWSDDRVKTDEGLLEVCGCTKDKAKEYAKYCKKVIEDIDNKRK